MKKHVVTILLTLLLAMTNLMGIDVVIGTGSAVTGAGSVSPYGHYRKNVRIQYLITGSELLAAGAFEGNITSLAFNVTNVNTCTSLPNYRIRLKNTGQTALTTTFETGVYMEVAQYAAYMPTVGWNIHTFDTPYPWDGSSNILVDAIFDMDTVANQSASVYYTSTMTPAPATCKTLFFASNTVNASTALTGSTSYSRANMMLNFESFHPDLVISPDQLNFGDQAVLVDNTITVTLSTSDYGTIHIDSGDINVLNTIPGNESNFYLVASEVNQRLPVDVDANNPFSFLVHFKPLTAGVKSANLEIIDNRAASYCLLTGTGVVPPGANCANPVIINSLPLTYNGTTQGFVNDYTSAMFTPASSYHNGPDWVGRFTLTEASCVSGSVNDNGAMAYPGVYIVNQVPSLTSPASVLASATTTTGGTASFGPTLLAAGVYYVMVDNYYATTRQFTPFTLNLSAVSATPTVTAGLTASGSPIFNWNPIPGTNIRYYVYWDENPNGAFTNRIGPLTGTEFQMYSNSGSVFVKVRAANQ